MTTDQLTENIKLAMFMEIFVESAMEQGYTPSVYKEKDLDYYKIYPTKE